MVNEASTDDRDYDFPYYRACTTPSSKSVRFILNALVGDDVAIIGSVEDYSARSVKKSSIKLLPYWVHFSAYTETRLTDNENYDQFRTDAELEALGRTRPTHPVYPC